MIADLLEQEVRNRGLDLAIERTDCMRMCRYGPYVRLLPDGKEWHRVGQADIFGIVNYITSANESLAGKLATRSP